MAERARKVSTAVLLELIRVKGPFLTEIAKASGLKYSAVVVRFYRNAVLKKAIQEAREELVDYAESELWKAIRAGDIKSCRYVLDRLGKNRGYTTRNEVIDLTEPKQNPLTPELNGMTVEELKDYISGLANAAIATADLQDS